MMAERLPFADIAAPSVATTGDGVFTYAVPEHLIGQLEVGQLVRIPLRRRLEAGVAIRLHEEMPDFELRPVRFGHRARLRSAGVGDGGRRMDGGHHSLHGLRCDRAVLATG